jgi:hypothetical protein
LPNEIWRENLRTAGERESNARTNLYLHDPKWLFFFCIGKHWHWLMGGLGVDRLMSSLNRLHHSIKAFVLRTQYSLIDVGELVAVLT